MCRELLLHELRIGAYSCNSIHGAKREFMALPIHDTVVLIHSIKNQKRFAIGVILLTEYHASFIRLRRVVLLRSDIRYASFVANKISLKP